MATDTYVQVAPDSSGKLIDSQSLTNLSGSTTYRQTVTLGDGTVLANIQGVDGQMQALVRDIQVGELLVQILVEMRLMTQILHTTLNSRDDIDVLRKEISSLSLQASS